MYACFTSAKLEKSNSTGEYSCPTRTPLNNCVKQLVCAQTLIVCSGRGRRRASWLPTMLKTSLMQICRCTHKAFDQSRQSGLLRRGGLMRRDINPTVFVRNELCENHNLNFYNTNAIINPKKSLIWAL
jgi:hypothetical protein